jgi:hypothetical protein
LRQRSSGNSSVGNAFICFPGKGVEGWIISFTPDPNLLVYESHFHVKIDEKHDKPTPQVSAYSGALFCIQQKR